MSSTEANSFDSRESNLNQLDVVGLVPWPFTVLTFRNGKSDAAAADSEAKTGAAAAAKYQNACSVCSWPGQ